MRDSRLPSLLMLSALLLATTPFTPSWAEEISQHEKRVSKKYKQSSRPANSPVKSSPKSGKGASSHHRSGIEASDAETLGVHGSRVRTHGAEVAITRATMDQFVSGTNPMQILAQTTPGVNFTSTDAFGLDTWANNLYMRGFTQDQIGASLDGMPLGGQGYLNSNGVAITQAIIQDDIGGMSMSQGAGALDMFSAQNLGGAISYVSRDPQDKAGGKISQTFGSFNAFRTYGRVDSGILNSTGTKFYASFARTKSNLWKGVGYQSELQADAKVVQPVGDTGKITAFFGYGNFTQANYMPMNLNTWRKMGRDATFLKPDYEKAKLWAYYAQYTSDVPPGYQGILSNDDVGNYVWDGSQIQRTYLSYINGHFDLFKNVTSDTVAYAGIGSGTSGYTNNFVTSPSSGAVSLLADGTVSGVPMALGMPHYFSRRLGFTQKFSIEAPHHNHIETGVWYENNYWRDAYRLYEDYENEGHNSNSDFKQSQAHTWYDDSFNTNTFQFFLQDRWTIIPGMNLLAGFKSLTQTTHGGTKADYTAELEAEGWNPYYRHPVNGTMTASSAFLPHFNFDYLFLNHHEFYWDIAENLRAYDFKTQTSGGPWGGLGTSAAGQTAQDVFDANKNKLRPERTWNYVVGYRYNSNLFSGSVDFYHTDYYNRLATITEGTTSNAYTAYLNVGRETVNGADVQGTVRPFKGLSITNSFSWADAEYQTKSINYAGSTYSLKGKKQVYYPKFMYKADLTYVWRQATFNFNVNYIGARPITFLNDEKVPAYWLASLGVGYNFGKVGFVHGIKTNFGITNLFNKNYIGGITGSAGISGDDNYNLFVAAPREFYGTVSAEF
ncbi:TonB-dependent receptor domain-containing protein [Acetobacter sp. DsW_063]|uniref:TonB-dependent receptor domain-containing protein n=1 Tax=Acetobacter sp. DsW_063 TaxID=1514894 RepID=UPI002101C1AB|nr:TonB-dependent receptor [Acetobacter sp. DsW_063]